jgi:hypothetical protein
MQPPAPLSGALLFIGRHTFEIYAIQLACYELIVKFFPDLASWNQQSNPPHLSKLLHQETDLLVRANLPVPGQGGSA